MTSKSKVRRTKREKYRRYSGKKKSKLKRPKFFYLRKK
jgi:hypothetical protein